MAVVWMRVGRMPPRTLEACAPQAAAPRTPGLLKSRLTHRLRPGKLAGAMTESPPLPPPEGLCVLHLFYRVERGIWETLDDRQRTAARAALDALVDETREMPGTQLLTFAMLTPKADLGFMLLTPDPGIALDVEKRLGSVLGAEVISPAYSYLSMTERSEYTTSEAEYARTIEQEEGLVAGTPAHAEAVEAWRTRMAKYLKDRLYPRLPGWPLVCFYPMSKRRGEVKNWFALPFEERKRLMGGHARTGRKWHGRILQLITGSTGLDSDEWGVTLLAHELADLKGIIYEMRFDPVSADYGEFGDFFVGLQLPAGEILRRVGL